MICKKLNNQKGFSLIEMIMIIVVMAILMPVVLQPFISASKGVGVSSNLTRMSLVARANLSIAIQSLQGATGWPTSVAAGGAVTGKWATVTDTVDGRTFSTTITGQFKNFADPAFTNSTTISNYLWITVTTTEPSSGKSFSLNALKSQDYSVQQ